MADILNILVVEDEKPIRDDLASFPWDECGAFLIGIPEILPELHDLRRDELDSMNRSAERSVKEYLTETRVSREIFSHTFHGDHTSFPTAYVAQLS